MGDTHTEPDRHTLIAEDRDSTHTTTCVGGEESSTGPSAVVRDRTGRTVKGWDFFHARKHTRRGVLDLSSLSTDEQLRMY